MQRLSKLRVSNCKSLAHLKLVIFVHFSFVHASRELEFVHFVDLVESFQMFWGNKKKMQMRHSGTKEVSNFFLAGFPWNSLSDFHSPLLSQPCHYLMTKATWSIAMRLSQLNTKKIKWANYLVICSKTFFPSNFLLGSATGSTLLICRTWYESRKNSMLFLREARKLDDVYYNRLISSCVRQFPWNVRQFPSGSTVRTIWKKSPVISIFGAIKPRFKKKNSVS